jgi:hypothetical protein
MQRTSEPVDRRALESKVAVATYLRGLALIPMGLYFIVGTLATRGVGPFRHLSIFVAAMLVISAASLYIHHYYEQHYGRASLSQRQKGRAWVAGIIGFTASIVVALGLRYGLDVPVNPVLIVWALALLTGSAVSVGMWPHHVVIAGALLLAGLVPVWHGEAAVLRGALLAGLGSIVIGILDHRVFVRTLGPPAGRSLEARDAGA